MLDPTSRQGAELKGGTIGEPDDWLGSCVRSIHPGLRFPFERLNRFGWQVAAPGLGWREQVGARRRRDRGVGRTRRRLVPTRGRDTEIIGTADDGSGFIYSVLHV